jgi:hypothetical protein
MYTTIFEKYFLPICFTIGFIGNTLGIVAILSASKLRKRNIYFIIAIIGISDNILLSSQLQRWLSIYIDAHYFLIDHSLCKVYLLLIRFSVLISSLLILILTLTTVIKQYLGAYRLSIQFELGQIFSKLSILISISLSLSLSWHELWTSGLKNATEAIHLEDDENESLPIIDYNSFNLTCSKNIDSFIIIEILNYVYLLMNIIVHLFLIINSYLIYMKQQKINNQTRTKKQKLKYGTENETKPSTSKAIDTTTNNNNNYIQLEDTDLTKTRISRFLITISVINTCFCLPFVLFDLIFYENVPILSDSIGYNVPERLPLILINIPHMIKFYLLFLFSHKYRSQLSRLVRIRIQFNFKIMQSYFKPSLWFSSSSSSSSSNNNNIKSDLRLNRIHDDDDDPDHDEENFQTGSNEIKKKEKKIKLKFYSNCFP